MDDLYPAIPGLCACGCGQKLAGRRRKWATDECAGPCVERLLILKGHSATITAALLKRDKGICARCRKDTLAEQRRQRETRRLWEWLAARKVEERIDRGEINASAFHSRRVCINVTAHLWVARAMRDAGWHRSGHTWEAHHKVAVAEGGGGCDLSGYETLCLGCHKRETRALMARLRERKAKAQLVLSI